MTEYWVSNKMHWCGYCKVWMQDNPQAKALHEKGTKHQAAVAKKLRDMRKTADADKAQRELAAKTIDSIEDQARKQYAKDQADAAAARAKELGEWVFDEAAGYFYNAVQRYYYDSKTKNYYGGDPPTWNSSPAIPPEALFEAQLAGGATEATAAQEQQHRTAEGQSAKSQVVRKVIKAAKHPMADIGGYQMPSVGVIGGAKQLGDVSAVGIASHASDKGGKRGRDDSAKKELSAEEAEAVARREAARQRVEARTLKTFGMAL